MSPQKVKPDPVVRRPAKVPLTLLVNGSLYALEIEPRRTLLDVLRNDLHVTGAKKACDMGECGACTILLNGEAVYSCIILAVECEDIPIITVEGLSKGTDIDPVQQAFIDHDAFQCGFCTSGQIISVKALLDNNPDPSQAEIRTAISGNLCRCGSYPRIIDAAAAAAKTLNQKQKSPKSRK